MIKMDISGAKTMLQTIPKPMKKGDSEVTFQGSESPSQATSPPWKCGSVHLGTLLFTPFGHVPAPI